MHPIPLCAGVRCVLFTGLMTIMASAGAAQPLQAPCKDAKFLASGMDSLVAMGQHKQVYKQFPIDVSSYESGSLVIDIIVGHEESKASFNLFPANTKLPQDGSDPTTKALEGAY